MPLLLAQIEIGAPGRLIVLVLLPALVYLAMRGRSDQPVWQWWTSTSLRCLVFALLCIAWAVPSCRRVSERKFLVFAIDASWSSFSDTSDQLGALNDTIEEARAQHDVRWFCFAENQQQFVTSPDGITMNGAASRYLTDIAGALHFAQANCPADRVSEIVLLSDGLETQGDVVASAISSTVPISVIPVRPLVRPELAVDTIVAPASVRPHEPVDLTLKLLSNKPEGIRLNMFRDGNLIAGTEFVAQRGETIWRMQTTLGEGRLTTFQAKVIASSRVNVHRENDALSVVVARGETARIMVVADDTWASKILQQAIQSGGFEVDTLSPSDFPTSTAIISDYQLVVLNEISAGQLSSSQLTTLDNYVRDGGGLIVIGGEETFGAAAYELTALEKMLPVIATEQPVEQQKSLALVLVVDKSRSMLDENRLGLAKEAAKKVAGVLQERDQVGVLAFGDEAQWISRLAPLDNKDEVLDRIDKLEAAGLTNMYPAIERAYLSLSQADADSRHVILLTDGVPTPGDFDAVARRMADAGITVSTVSLGKGADQTILEDISRIARGNHYHVDNPSDLPKILERETRTAASKVTDQQYAAQTFRQLPGLNIGDAPALKNYVATNYKPGAQLLLTAGDGDPLLAWWRYGRGKAMVLTTDFGESAKSWNAWQGNAAFWKRLVTYTMSDAPPEEVTVDVKQHNGRVTVTLDAVTHDGDQRVYITDGVAVLEIGSLGGTAAAKTINMPQVAPGQYAASFDANPGEQFQLDITLRAAGSIITQQRRGIVINYPEEFRLRPTDEEKLRAIAAVSGGKYDPTPEEIFAPDGRTVDVLFPLWQYFLIGALLSYLADVAVRRARQPTITVLETKISKAA